MKMRRIISKIRNNAGMTMIEVTIAGVVLMGAVIVMISMFDTALSILEFTTSRSLATQIGNEVLEDFRSLDYPQAVLYDSGVWPEDSDLTSDTPPKYIDVGGEPRSLLTTDTAAGLAVEESRERQHINFIIRRYVFYVPDGANAQAFKRLVVKVKWTGGNSPGEVVLTTNFALEDKGEARPLGKILGVRSTNYNYFLAQTEETTMGLDDSIRGPKSGVITPVVWTEAVITGAKASYIDRVEYQLYDPAGAVVRETTVESDSVNADGRYFKWPLNTMSPVVADGAGYLIRAEAFDDLGRSNVDGMRVNIDNTNPPEPNSDTAPGPGAKTINVSWTWSDPSGVLPERGRFIISRGSKNNYAAVSGATRLFLDTGLSTGVSYTYRVSAVDSAGNISTRSDRERTRTISPFETIAPQTITAATAEALSWKSVTLGWNQVLDTGGSGLAGYRWESSDDNVTWTIIGTSAETSASPAYFTDENLKPGKSYWYRVKAFDTEGNISAAYPSPALLPVITPMR